MVLKVFHFISAKTSSSSPSSLKFLHEITLNCPSSLSSEKLKTQNWKLTFFLQTYHQSSIPLVLLNQVSSSPCWVVWKITLWMIDYNDEYIENVGSSEIWNCRQELWWQLPPQNNVRTHELLGDHDHLKVSFGIWNCNANDAIVNDWKHWLMILAWCWRRWDDEDNDDDGGEDNHLWPLLIHFFFGHSSLGIMYLNRSGIFMISSMSISMMSIIYTHTHYINLNPRYWYTIDTSIKSISMTPKFILPWSPALLSDLCQVQVSLGSQVSYYLESSAVPVPEWHHADDNQCGLNDVSSYILYT